MFCTVRSASSRARARRSAQLRRRAGEQRLGVRDLDLQQGQGLADLVVQFAREPAPALLFDLQQARGELLQFLFGLLHGGEVAVGFAFQVLGVPQAEAGHQDAEQDAEAEHQQQAFGGAPPRAGEFAFAVLQHALVGGGDFAQGVVEFAAARHHLALRGNAISCVVGGVEHGLRQLFRRWSRIRRGSCGVPAPGAMAGRALAVTRSAASSSCFELSQLARQVSAPCSGVF